MTSLTTEILEVARECLKAGASMINDVSGFRDPAMVKVAADFDVPICCMHMLGNPKTMQNAPYYKEGIMNHLVVWARERIASLTASGIKKSNIIIDPGIGFGKTVADPHLPAHLPHHPIHRAGKLQLDERPFL